ncbi:methionyl-tRNA formyltransferase [Moraxella nonliquefaciens]|uniref:methionyl-tRNA formyltransferase n=1 Tax=Moraxella nonliquefaciens TaxID=478 RepID=UPI00081DBC27|nr:methionyl-tRNA formyltransferase [Moraxella nonliquefaciens]OBX50717.1 methionyl-tRNA formyltransferase [Moraxella nonliquefaciens]
MNHKLRLIFAGTPEFAKVALQALIDHQDELNIDIVAVYTQPDRKAGRGQKLTPSPVKELALSHNIPVEQPISFSLKSENGQVSRETLANYRPDVMIVCAYGLILPIGVLGTPTFGCLNIHASLLPKWRGAAPIQRAILADDATTGITIMQMNQGLDTGDMLYKLPCDITNTDTTQTLHDKLAKLGGVAMTTVLKDLATYQANAKPQDDSLANYAEKVSSDEGQINWQNSAHHINRQICALNAFTFLNGERIKVLECMPIKLDQTTTEMPAKIVSVGKKAVLIACGADDNGDKHLINITKMQWAGGKPLTAEQIAVGDKLKDGEIFDGHTNKNINDR